MGFVVEWEREIGKVTEKMKERIDWWLEEGGDEYVPFLSCCLFSGLGPFPDLLTPTY